MSQPTSNHAKGLALTAVGGLVLTFDIPLIKLAGGDAWSVLLLRTATTFVAALAAWLVWKRLDPKLPPLVPGWPGVAVAVLYGISSTTFLAAVYLTSTANVVFILAFNTMFAALLSWAFIGERPKPATFVAMAVTVIGVGIIVSDSLGSGNLLGDFLAGCSALLIAAAITITRATGRDMGFTSLVSVLLPFTIAAFFVADGGFHMEAPWWIVLNGAVVIPLAFFCLATGPKYISGPEVAMFYLLETVLAPVWVWIIFSEAVSPRTLVGGAILIAALVAHSLWQLSSARRAARVIRHPV
ncbi:MAG: DMT family transporter [Rhizobiaceae bacterium]|nr:DMT family transporter [Rhizobiaceae bacterium]